MIGPRAAFLESPLFTRLSLWGTVGLALLFRLPGIRWGLPLKYAHIDESVVIHYSLRIVAGALNPDFYDYPGFFLYLLAGLIRLGALVHGWVFGEGLEALVGGYLAGDATFFTLTARGLTVVFALLTVGLAFSMGLRRSRWVVGLGAATLIAVNALHIRSSHYGMIDVTAAFFTLLAMDKIVEFGLTQRIRDGAVAAFLVGLGAATKYYPGILIVPLALLPFLEKHPRPFRMFFVVGGMSVIGLFVGSPFTLLSAGEFLSRFKHLAPKIVGIPTHSVPFIPTIVNLWQNAGPVALLAGVTGLGYAFWEKGANAPWRLLAILWLTLFIFLGCWTHQPAHYGLALYPPLFLFGIHAADRIPWRHPMPVLLLVGVLMVYALPSAVREIQYLQRPDTRLLAADWVRGNIPPGSKILRFSHTPDFKRSDPFQITVDFTDERLAWMGQGRDAQDQGIKTLSEFDYMILGGDSSSVDDTTALFDDSFVLLKRFTDPAPSGFHNPMLSIYATRDRPFVPKAR